MRNCDTIVKTLPLNFLRVKIMADGAGNFVAWFASGFA